MKTLSSKPELFEPKAYVAKLENRQIDWQWNRPLLLSTLACMTLVALGSFASYRYHTTLTSKTYFARAKAAGESGDLAEQAKWLQRYLLLQPQDIEAVVTVAIATDDAVELASPAQRYEAVDRARRLLSSSIARLGPQNPDQLNDLRERLIKRLIQLGRAWYREAERQVVSLAAEPTDPRANRWMAEALVGQVRLASYDSRMADRYNSTDDYWNWLSQQKPGEVLIEAIKLNPNETDLIGSLVELFQASPEMFAQVGGNAEQRDAALAKRVESMLAGIAANTDSRSLWIRYLFEQQRGQIEKADQILLPAAEQAAAKLASAAAEIARGKATAAAASEQSGTPISNPLVSSDAENAVSDQPLEVTEEQAAEQFCDYLLLSEAARRVSESDPPRAMAYYDQLTAYRPSSVRAGVVESVYLTSGQLVLQQGDADAAIEIWNRGLDVIPTSLDLLGSLARLQVYQLQANPGLLDPTQFESVTSDEETAAQTGNVDMAIATATLKRFTDAIDSLSTRLIQATDAELPRDAKLTLGRRLETARWRAQVMRATLATLDDRPREAIADLRTAMATTADVDDSEQIAAALQLALLYQNEGAWDQVALTLDEAIKRSPGNVVLRARAADAWARAGDQNQSLQQWRLTGSSNSIEIQVASIEAQLNDQARLPAQQQDFSGLRVAVRNARNQHAAAIKNWGVVNAKVSGEPNTATSETAATQPDPGTIQSLARLEIVSVLLPPPGMAADQYWQSPEFAAALDSLAQQYPGELLIQAFAAERFALLGNKDQSQQAFERLEALLGADSVAVAMVQARVKANQGDVLGAAQGLIRFAESLDLSGKPETDEIFRIAATYAMRDGQAELAYETLLKIPAQRRSLSTEFLLARLAQQLPADSAIFQSGAAASSPEQLSLEWEQQLQQREGESGSYWRFLRITRMVDQLRGQADTIKRDDPKLRQARQTLKELLILRPRWGEAISLEGWLLSIEGQTERAVEFLRRGIAAGDRRMQTRTQLWQQLVRLGREAEVDEDIRAAAAASGQPLEQYASTRIELAVRQGDYQRSVEVARQAADQSPGDAVAQVVLARTAALAATRPELAETRAALLEQARQAIAAATAIDGANEASVVSARMAVTVAGGDQAEIRAEIDKLGESKLPEFERLMLGSQALVAIKDYEAALPLLKKADEVRPSSRTQLALAALYRELKRSEDEVAALRRAQQSEPDNPALRNQLAQALVARDGGEIDWREIEELLQTSTGVTEINRFMYAILLGTRGQTQQQEQAATILREIIQERNARSDDAARVLAAIRRRQMETLLAGQATVAGDDNATVAGDDNASVAGDDNASAAGDDNASAAGDDNVSAAGEDVAVETLPPKTLSPEALRLGNEVRELYDSLTSKLPPEAIDLYRYADFLLQLGAAEDLVKVGEMLERLKSSPQGSLASLEIGIRYAQKQGNPDTAPEIIDQWAERVALTGDIDSSRVASIAGASLVRLGFVDEGLRWFQQAYQQNTDVLSNYVITLVQLDRAEEARKLSVSHYDEHQDATSAMLLSELMLGQPETQRDPADQQRVDQAVKEFSRNAPLLESVATLRMQQDDYSGAIDLYQRAHAVEPLRVRTLNNLAMAFSEVPGREAEGILPIQQAINLAGEIPELLDTKGVVLLKARKFVEAEQAFRSAIEQQPDEPRFQFHLILSLMQQGKEAEAKRQWTQLQIDDLDPSGLTAAERNILEQMKQKFGT